MVDDLTKELFSVIENNLDREDVLDHIFNSLPKELRGTFLTVLASSFLTRYERTGSLDDINRSVAAGEKAADLVGDENLETPDPDVSITLQNLGNALYKRFQKTRTMEDLNKSVARMEQALAANPADQLDRATQIRRNLAKVLQIRFTKTDSMDDLDRTISMYKQAVAATPVDHPEYVVYVYNLGNVLQLRFETWKLAGSILREDLDRAITMKEKAVALTPNDHPDRVRYLHNLASALYSRFSETGSFADLDRSILIREQVITSTENDPESDASDLHDLSLALIARFEEKGSVEDCNRAISLLEKLVSSGSGESISRLNTLSTALQRRFEWSGSMSDINRAITLSEKTVAASSNNKYCADHLSNLASALQLRFERTHILEDLNRAIEAAQRAVKLTRNDNPHRPAILTILSLALESRFKKTGSLDDLDELIRARERAVKLTPKDNKGRAGRLSNLGSALYDRFEKKGSLVDINTAILLHTGAVECTQDNHPDRALILNNLANAVQARLEKTRKIEDLEVVVETKEQALAVVTARPFVRIQAAASISPLIVLCYPDRTKSLFHAAVQLLPALSPRTLKRSDQQHHISQFAKLTSSAVAMSLACRESPYDALRILEVGRGVLASLQLEIRSDISNLANEYPELARQFDNARDGINLPSDGKSGIYDVHQLQLQYNRFETILASIRRLPSFENFLLGPSEEEMKALAGNNSIVVFNISHIRSDAFLISKDGIRSQPLPLLKSDDLIEYTNRFIRAIDTSDLDYRTRKNEVSIVLEWLWDKAVGPILDELGHVKTPQDNESWPSVCWIPSRWLNILPIHAAGYHETQDCRNALDRVISSYAVSLKSLAYARKKLARSKGNSLLKQRAILFGMPKTTDMKDLPFVDEEINRLKSLLSSYIETKVVKNPTKEQVLLSLSENEIVHIACHGYLAPDPSLSSLLLADWKSDPLTVLNLTTMNIEPAEFAYLSACHTSNAKDHSLLDESISLTSTIHLSGYPSVVGTLWQVSDKYSAETATEVYTWMYEGGRLETTKASEALHRAVRRLRDRTRNAPHFSRVVSSDPLIWAPYIHVGV